MSYHIIPYDWTAYQPIRVVSLLILFFVFSSVVLLPRISADDIDTNLACFIICADGGSNRYYELMKAQGKESEDVSS